MSVTIKLPDGSRREYADAVTPLRVAEDISPRLAKAAVAAIVDGKAVDMAFVVPAGEHELKLLTDRDAQGLEVLRHTAAHVMAQAMVRLYGSGVKYTIGPALMDDFQYGFYYDFDLPSPITQEDLPKIEAEMQKVVDEKLQIQRHEVSSTKARLVFQVAPNAQPYKVVMIDDLVREEHATTISLYQQGDFTDMCRGPHLPDTGRLKAFKLLSVAGAYWRGDEKNKMLTRIYGIAFFDKKQLDEHLVRIEEARKRDHRVIGKQLGLFLISDAVGPGLPLWLPKGTILRMELQNWLQSELLKRGYQLVVTPHIGKLDLYRRSGHFPYYMASQFAPLFMHPLSYPLLLMNKDLPNMSKEDKDKLVPELDKFFDAAPKAFGRTLDIPEYHKAANAEEKMKVLREWYAKQEEYLLKPMNCPHHIQIYMAAQRSYRDLPLRLAEFGTVYRMEQSGELNGLTRVRGFTQDDAHIFCAPEQLEGEIESCVDLVKLVLGKLGLNDYRVRIGLGDRSSNKYVGEPALWETAESNIRGVVRNLGLSFTEEAGEAAFYGPKIDFIVRDCIGREWQLGTIQVDYNLPERFGLEYIGADNRPHRPVMVHRAPFGSLERFIGILIEHFAGAFPLWLAPTQVAVLPVSDKYNDYGRGVLAELLEASVRAEINDSPEKIGAKIRKATIDKVPYMLVLGQREQESRTVAVRHRTEGDRGAIPLADFLAALLKDIRAKG